MGTEQRLGAEVHQQALQNKKTISEMADALDSEFDRLVAEGSDDELFASGYLRGHFDLIVAQLTMAGEESQSAFWPGLIGSVKDNANELSYPDRVHVENMIVHLQHHAILAE